MNYSKDSRQTNKKETSESTSNSKKKQKKAKLSFLRVLFIIIIIGIFAIAGAGIGALIGILQSAPDISTLELKPTTNYTSFLYDQNGSEIDRLSSGENRIYVELDKIPQHFQDAVIAIEDERFYDHIGIDLRGIFRALLVNLQTGSFTEGASTITQQLIKNNILTTDKTFTRKIQEQYLAIQFEQIYTKDLILEYYLNTFHLGHGEYGVQAAANYYFAKDASELTLAESAVLAGITKYPTRYSPILNPETNWERAQIVLNKMEELEMITAEEKASALAENPYENIAQVQQELADSAIHSYFVDAVVDQVVVDLQQKNNLTLTQANNLIFGGGLQIFTTLDQNMQNIVDEQMANDANFPSYVEYEINYAASIEKPDGTVTHRGGKGVLQSDSEENLETFKNAKLAEWGAEPDDKIYGEVLQVIPQAQAAFVVMDHHNGHVKALSGGRGEKYGDRVFNRATQALRQPGSVFKVLAAYAPALDTGILSPGSVIVDEKYSIGNYAPNNWYSGFRGPTTVREGIYDSMNILAVKALEMVGLNTAFDYLLNFGFTTLTEAQDKYYPLALGGIGQGVSPLELTAAYAAIANEGVYIEPILYTQVLDRDGNVILDNSAPASHTVIKESTAYMLTDMMVDTLKKGTAGTLNRTFTTMPIAGKTGTTNDDKDFLFAGYTPYYTATVWMGYDAPEKFSIGSPQRHQLLWGNIMKEIHADLPSIPFEKVTTGYVHAKLCGTSGLLPTQLCTHASGNLVTTDYFLASEVPNTYCTAHAEVKRCTVSGKIANEYCPSDVVSTQIVASGSNAVTTHDLCDVHTADTVDQPSLWPPSWPDLPGFGDEDEDDNNSFNPNDTDDDVTSEDNNTSGDNSNGNTSDEDDNTTNDSNDSTTDSTVEEPSTDSSDIEPDDTLSDLLPPEPVLPPSLPEEEDEEDNFYIPQS